MRKINKILPLFLTTTAISTITPCITSCKDDNSDFVLMWKKGWGILADHSENRNYSITDQYHRIITSLDGTTQTETKGETKDYYKAKGFVSSYRKSNFVTLYNFKKYGASWLAEAAKVGETYDAGVATPRFDSIDDLDFEEISYMFALFTGLYGLFSYNKSTKTASWEVYNNEETESNYTIQVKFTSDSKVEELIFHEKYWTTSNFTYRDTTETYKFDYSEQTINLPNEMEYQNIFSFASDGTKLESERATQSSTSRFLFTNYKSGTPVCIDGLNRINFVHGTGTTTPYISKIEIIKNDKILENEVDYKTIFESEVTEEGPKGIKLLTPLKADDKLTFVVNLTNKSENFYFTIDKVEE